LLDEVALGQINQKMNSAFAENNIAVPFNTLTVNFSQEEDKKQIAHQLQSSF